MRGFESRRPRHAFFCATPETQNKVEDFGIRFRKYRMKRRHHFGYNSDEKGLFVSRYIRTLSFLLLAVGLAAAADQPVQFSVGLVQVDAVVTDAKGALVSDLTPADFEVWQDGKKQTITQCRYVHAPHQQGPSRPALGHSLAADEVNRTFAVVVDDLGADFADLVIMKRNLLRLVENEVQPNDLWAFYRTSGGSSANESFSSDPRQIRAAVESMHFVAGLGWRRDVTSAFALNGLLMSTIHELGAMPGRKSLILLHSGDLFSFRKFLIEAAPQVDASRAYGSSEGNGGGVYSSLAATADMVWPISDAANRASVAIYAVDLRGLTAVGDTGTNLSMRFLSSQTGGYAFYNGNNTYEYLRKVVNDDSGFYLIGWDPGQAAFAQPKGKNPYHHIKLKTLRNGLTIRTRDGFFAKPAETNPPPASAQDALTQTLFAPFRSGGIELELTAGIQHDSQFGSYVESLVHIAPKNLNFVDKGKGCYALKLEMLSTAQPLDWDKGTTNGQISDFDFCGESAKQVLRDGLVYVLKTKITQPGNYEMRVAARCATPSGEFKSGSAREYVQVPDLKKTSAALGGITLQNSQVTVPAVGASSEGRGGQLKADYREAVVGDPAYRVFKPGDTISFRSLLLPGTLLTQTTSAAKLQILYDGQEVHSEPLAVNNSVLAGEYHVARDAKPGVYALAVQLAGDGKMKTNQTQMIDFVVQ